MPVVQLGWLIPTRQLSLMCYVFDGLLHAQQCVYLPHHSCHVANPGIFGKCMLCPIITDRFRIPIPLEHIVLFHTTYDLTYRLRD